MIILKLTQEEAIALAYVVKSSRMTLEQADSECGDIDAQLAIAKILTGIEPYLPQVEIPT